MTELQEAERVAAMSDQDLNDFIDQILLEQMRKDKRLGRVRALMIACAIAVAWCCGAACTAMGLQ
jgi:hypothetical protein